MAKKSQARRSVRDALRVAPGALDPDAIPIGPSSKSAASKELADLGPRLADLQELLYAEGVTGGSRGILLVLQGMDTSGKGGTIDHVCGLVNPQGLHIASFKKPTRAELRHHYLWRIRRQLPAPGLIGVFDRSHYEDVLVVRVNSLVPRDVWSTRYDEINEFESELVAAGTTLIKCFLHISPDEQRERLIARLKNPAKQWKYNPGDLDARSKWSAYHRNPVGHEARPSTAGLRRARRADPDHRSRPFGLAGEFGDDLVAVGGEGFLALVVHEVEGELVGAQFGQLLELVHMG